MTLSIPGELLGKIQAHGEAAYPEEGAGLLLGRVEDDRRQVVSILPMDNSREAAARRNRYLLTPHDMLLGEQEAEARGLEVIGVFHSHPDAPSRPSEFDRDWALPWYSYLITSITAGQASSSRSWRLPDDRSVFSEEVIEVANP